MALTLRKSNIRKLREEAFDVLIIGGGINGAVAAASLAGRGVRTALIEREDFASGVSSSSSNLAWGGIKYLETHEYLLVNKLCRSRNQLMDAYRRQLAPGAADEAVGEAVVRRPAAGTLLFMLGELPFITALYERARAELTEDRDLTVDGVKELLLAARARYRRRSGKPARRITPKMLSIYLRYVRNLSLIERRLTPDLYTLAVAARQVAGDGFAISLVETARQYAYEGRPERPEIVLGIGRGRLDDGRCVGLVSRLPGPPVHWRTLGLRPPPPAVDRARWRMLWNPFGQVSWPAEDVAVERFRAHVFDRARAVMGADQARAEKFTTSLRDGLDIRETLRNWYAGDLYVKVLPPAVGTVDGVVMLFDTPADPRDYPWRSTWYAEHDQESTLAFYATNFLGDIVGPGIAQATYGGAMFLYPPRAIPDVWTDAHLDFADTLEERLLGAACLHTAQRNVVLLSPRAPTASWRKIARRFRRRWVHLPLSHFSASTVEQLRTFHVLNGRQVRSYAAYFIRRP